MPPPPPPPCGGLLPRPRCSSLDARSILRLIPKSGTPGLVLLEAGLESLNVMVPITTWMSRGGGGRSQCAAEVIIYRRRIRNL